MAWRTTAAQHNLIVLIDLALPFGEVFETLRETARPLLPFAVGVRYPQIEHPPDAEEAAQALHRAEEICQTVRTCLFGP